MKTANLNPPGSHAASSAKGTISTTRAGSKGIRLIDAARGVDMIAKTVYFTGAVVTDPDDDDDSAFVDIVGGTGSGGSGSGVGSYAGTPVPMLNSYGSNIGAGTVVVVDQNTDNAVTLTTTAADTRIVGVTQAAIASNAIGPVLFNGYTGGVITTGSITRGYYLTTSTVAGAAQAVGSNRTAGTFAVVTSVADLSRFARDSALTLSSGAVTSLTINVPTAPINRVLFLALYRDPTVVTTPTISGWTRIGSTSGFYYYYRVTTGTDPCVATWTTASAATATVLLLDGTVDVTNIVQTQAFDATTAAAAISGMSASSSRYAVAGVQGDALTTAPSGWTLLGAGTTGTVVASPAIVQHADSTNETTGYADLPVAATAGNLILVRLATRPNTATLAMDPGSGYTSLGQVDIAGERAGSAAIFVKQAAGGEQRIKRDLGFSAGAMVCAYEISSATVAMCTLISATHQTSASPFTLSAHPAATGLAFDMFIVTHNEPGADRTWTGGAGNATWTEHWDGGPNAPGANDGPWIWTGNATPAAVSITPTVSLTPPAGKTLSEWGGLSVLISNDQAALGSLVGKYIATDAAVTSPFTGSTDQLDALFAINLTQAALPSALLYGPDLNHAGTPVTAPLILEDGTIAILEDGTAAMGETTYV